MFELMKFARSMISPFLIVAIALSVLYLFMVMYYFVGWLRIKKPVVSDPGAQPTDQKKLPFISVVIPVRNESKYIKSCLESVFRQNYPADLYEVIVIDDYSTDPTLRFAREFTQSNLLVLDLQQYLGNPGEYSPNKKKAIALGVKNAKGEIIITTDGDCEMGENWLRSMVSYYLQNDYKLLTGPVLIKPARNPFAWFQQLDVISMIGITGATIRNNFPTMCNGANLMYSKKVFLDVEGFKGNHEVPTGDDIFLMHKINDRFPGAIGFVKNYEACVFTKAEPGIGGFISQRVRWVSKSKRYSSFGIMLVLLFAYFFNMALLAAPLLLLLPGDMNWLPVAVIAGTKLFADLLFNIPVTWFFKKAALLLVLPFAEVFHALYVLIIGPLSLGGRYRWKDRLIR
jgi:cellulose synthase/poly-beta-1,6-N-acetylglucosamine synthase-like glycosyltransferase